MNIIFIYQSLEISDGYQIKSVTVSRTPSDEYYVSICLAYEELVNVKSKGIEKNRFGLFDEWAICWQQWQTAKLLKVFQIKWKEAHKTTKKAFQVERDC